MSLPLIIEVLDYSRAQGAARNVIAALARMPKAGTRTVWPAHSTIAARALVSERAVRGALTWLVEAGELIVVQDGGGRGKTTKYRIADLCALYGSRVYDDAQPEPEAETPANVAVVVPWDAKTGQLQTRQDLPGLTGETRQSVPETRQSVPTNPAPIADKQTEGTDRGCTAPPSPPQAGGDIFPTQPVGNRKTVLAEHQAQVDAFVAEHFPGARPSKVVALAGHLREKGITPTVATMRAYAAHRPIWTLTPDQLRPTG